MCEADKDESDGLLFGTTIRPGDSGDPYTERSARAGSDARGHRFCHFSAHRAMRVDQRWRHSEKTGLGLIGVGDYAFDEILRAPREVSQPACEHTSCTALSRTDRQLVLPEKSGDDFVERLTGWRADMVAEDSLEL